MDEKPKRRWFRFKLSSVLILTAILAWAMATRPYWFWIQMPPDPNGPVGKHDAIRFNSDFAWPALALLAFLVWKAAWAVAARRCVRSAQMEFQNRDRAAVG
ncbi:MAG: hypothetical protein AB7U73_05000 [Pirellulales bacterium]